MPQLPAPPSSDRDPSPAAHRRRQRGKGLPALAGLVLVLGLLGAAALWLLDDGPEVRDPPVVELEQPRDPRGPVVPEPVLGPARVLEVAPDPAAAEDPAAPLPPERRAELLALYAHTDLPGRVVMADGSDLPDGVQVEARRRQPHPRVVDFDLTRVRQLSAGAAFESLEPGDLARLTRTAVDAEGRFLLEDVPADTSFWVGVVSDAVYQPQARPVSVRDVDGELIVEVTRGAVLEGRVVDGEGHGVATLAISGSSTMDPWSMIGGGARIVELAEVGTDAQGRFRLSPVPDGSELVLRTKRERGFQATTLKVPPLVPGEVRQVELLASRGGRLAGRVVDTGGLPVVGTQVRLQPTRLSMGSMDVMGAGEFEVDTGTDDEGRFAYDGLSAGDYSLVLIRGGFLPTRAGPFTVAPGAPVEDVQLLADRGLSVSGRVVDETGAGLAGVSVLGSVPMSLMNMSSRVDKTLRSPVTTDETGAFRVSGFAQGDVQLVARLAGFTAATTEVAAGATDVTLVLERQAAISGIAIDLATAEPLTAYALQAGPSEELGLGDLMSMDERLRSLPAPLTVDDDEGRFELNGVDPGVYDLVLVAQGHARTVVEDVVVEKGQGARGLVIMVPEEAVVTGLVLSGRDGRPVPEARVTTGRTDAMAMVTTMLSGPPIQTVTDAEGRFRLDGLSGDELLTLSVVHESHRTLALPDVLPMEGDVLDLGVISLPAGATIWGEVSDALGEPEAGVAVLASDPRGSSMRRAVSDREGRYEMQGLAAGSYNVMRLDMSFSLDSDNPMSALEDMVFEAVELEEDEVKRVDLGLLDTSGVVLRGRVRGAAGPEHDAAVVLIREEGPPSMKFGSTNEEGEYLFSGVEPGAYVLQVIPSGSMAGGGTQPSSPVIDTLTVTAAAEQHHDVSVPGGALRGEVRAERGGERLAGVRVLLERVDEERPPSPWLERMGYRVGETYTESDGSFTFRHLPRGTYDLVVGGTNLVGLGDSGWAQQRVEGLEVREGSEGFREIVELEPGCAIAGVVSSQDGQPLRGVPVWVQDESTGRWISTLSELATDAGGRFEINSLDIGSYTVAVGGNNHAYRFRGGVRTTRDSTREIDITLEEGVEVLVRLNGHRRQDLSIQVSDPMGRAVPLDLVSMDQLMTGSRGTDQLRVGRVETGTYGVDVYERGELLLQRVETVRLDEDPLVIELPPVDEG